MFNTQILAGSSGASTGFYDHILDQSLKFNDDDSQYLTRTPASGGNQKVWTWSAWVKRGKLAAEQALFGAYKGGNDYVAIQFDADDTLNVTFKHINASGGSLSSQTRRKITTQVFRDVSSWYNIVVKFDAGNTNCDIYVNGTEVTSFSVNEEPQDLSFEVNAAQIHYIGTFQNSVTGLAVTYFDGYMAEINLIDGTALTASSFGETKNGIWIPKDTSGLTFGTNGFHLTFKDDVISEGFNTVTYRGTGASNSISGVGFSPAFVWLKDRTDTTYNYLSDVCRGATNEIYSNVTDGEYTGQTQTFKSFDGDGFTVGTNTGVNGSGDNMVGWCWEAGGTPTADNSAGAGATPTAGSVKIDGSNLGSALAGSIAATRLSADTAKGFSIVTYTGTGSAATVAHGLGAAPKWMIVKRRNGTPSWQVFHTSLGGGKSIELDGNSAAGSTTSVWNNTAPTSSVINIGTHGGTNTSSGTYVAYCWTDISGYSKFGSFTGNGGSQAIDVGFTPAFVMLRRTNGGTWAMFDNTRQSQNLQMLGANSTAAETTNAQMNFSGNTFNDNGYISDNGATVLYMAFADTREAAFFKDVTTNGNHFTPVNLDYRDSVPDTPTNNFAVMNSLEASSGVSVTLSEGNLKAVGTTVNYSGGITSTFEQSSGKWYWEVLVGSEVAAGSNYYSFIGAATGENNLVHKANNSQIPSVVSSIYGWTWEGDGTINHSGTGTKAVSSVSAPSAGDILGFAIDLDNGNVYFYYNGVAQNSGNAVITGVTGLLHNPMVGVYNGSAVIFNFGQDSSFAGNKATSNANADGNGHGSFAYAPPSGYLALCSQNLPNAAIIDGTEYFNTLLWSGDASQTRSFTGLGFQPDFSWLKIRSGTTQDHQLYDSVRGAGGGKSLSSNTTAIEGTVNTVSDGDYGFVSSFDADGFSVDDGAIATTGGYVNYSGRTYVAWNWLAGTAFSNDASATGVGTIDSSGQVNTKAGFSIVKHDNGSGTRTVAHGLSSAPEIIFEKKIDASGDWIVQFTVIDGTSDYMRLNTTVAKTDGSNALPTATVYSPYVGGGADCLAYCFHSVEGYSKVGSYVGNGNADGPFVFTGHRVSWVMIKASSTTGNWFIVDTVRDPFNPTDDRLYPNLSNTESDATALDSVSNGFKVRNTWSDMNTSGQTYIYLAFAEQPFKFANAR